MFQSTIQRAIKLVSQATNLLDLQRAKTQAEIAAIIGISDAKMNATKAESAHRVRLMSRESEARIKREDGKQVMEEERERDGKPQRRREDCEAAEHDMEEDMNQKKSEEKGEEDKKEEWRFWE